MFTYNGYHFEPERNLKECEDKNLYALSKHLKSDTELGMCNYETDWKKCDYSLVKFYTASCGSKCDLFRCVENGKLYIPGEHELFEFI